MVIEFIYILTVKEIRLAGNNVTHAGRVEVYIAGVWGTIRNRGWNLNAAHVACRELGYQGADAAIVFTVAPYGRGEGPVWMSNLDCQGHESSLWECSWSRIAGIYWDHENDAGVICTAPDDTGEYKLDTNEIVHDILSLKEKTKHEIGEHVCYIEDPSLTS